MDARHIHYCNGFVWYQQIHTFCALPAIPRISSLHLFFLYGKYLSANGLFKENKPQERPTHWSWYSLTLFYWHIHEDRFVLHILLYFIVNILSVFAIIHLFRTLNGIRSRIITYISIGTMVIFGLHRMMIGIIDFYIEKKINITNIIYDWYECIIIALAIEIILLPIITHGNKWPILLGKKKYYA